MLEAMRKLLLPLLLIGTAAATPASDLLNDGDYARAYAAALQTGELVTASRAAMNQAIYRENNSQSWLDRSIDLARKAVQQAPNSTDAHFVLGSALGNKARLTSSLFTALRFSRECRSEYELAVRLQPNNGEALISLARWHSGAYAKAGRISGGNPDTARKLALQVLQNGPATSFNLIQAGYVFFEIGEDAHGRTVMEKGLTVPAASAEEKEVQNLAKAYLSKK